MGGRVGENEGGGGERGGDRRRGRGRGGREGGRGEEAVTPPPARAVATVGRISAYCGRI